MSKVALTKPADNRQKIWAFLRTNRGDFVTTAQIAKACGIKPSAVYGYVQALVAAKYLSVQDGLFGRRKHYRLERDGGIDAPRLRSDGSFVQESFCEAVWRTMKILHSFTPEMLAAHVQMTHDVSERKIEKYTAALTAAGYLGRRGENELVLLKNTGSRAPVLMTVRELYDPNEDEIVLREVPNYD